MANRKIFDRAVQVDAFECSAESLISLNTRLDFGQQLCSMLS